MGQMKARQGGWSFLTCVTCLGLNIHSSCQSTINGIDRVFPSARPSTHFACLSHIKVFVSFAHVFMLPGGAV